MVAVFSGNGLGLFDSSLSALGGQAGGTASLGGQGRDRQYLNIATGNLVLQAADEVLQFRGMSVGLNRTYNSRGLLADTGGDAWVTGFERRVSLTGTVNTTGSVVRLQQGDGSYTDFQYDAARQVYLSTAGSGTHDTLSWDATSSTWTLTEGSTRRQDVFASHDDPVAAGRLIKIVAGASDGSAPAHFDVVYDAQGRISEISADGANTLADALLFGYDANGRLATIGTREAGTTRTQVAYEYDAIGRLVAVTTDLTPDDAADNTWDAAELANNDGHLFRTEYEYSGDSAQIVGIRQSDGLVVAYAYETDGRIGSVTYGQGNEATSFSLSYSDDQTDITDAAGHTWSYRFDAAGQLIEVLAPPVSGLRDSTRYAYDAEGNVLSVAQWRGAQASTSISYTYDSSGNVIRETDGAGNILVRSYSNTNQLLAETRYPIGTSVFSDAEPPPAGALRTRYVYDAQDRLRFTIDQEGRVTELQYASAGTGLGQRSALRQYSDASYTGSDFSEAALSAFAGGQQAASTLTTYTYDAAGRLSRTVSYADVDASGEGIGDSAAAVTSFVYDAQGQLRREATVLGTGPEVLRNVVDYAYDGLGRLLSVVHYARDEAGAQQVAQTQTYSYLDANRRIEIATGGAATQVTLSDSAGRAITSWLEAPQDPSVSHTQSYYYDTTGQLRAVEDAMGGLAYSFYDEKGRLAATVGASGEVVAYSYDGADRVIATTHYANRVTTTGWLVAGEVVPSALADIGLVADPANDRTTGSSYDAAGRVATTTDALGTVTTYVYDALGRMVQASTGAGPDTRITRNFYDRSGLLLASLDAEGYLTEWAYDAAGRKVRQVAYATPTDVAERASGALPNLRPAASDADQGTRWFYDGRGNLVGELDAEGYVTEYVFDEANNSRATLRYYHAVAGNLLQGTWAQIRSSVTAYPDGETYRQERREYDDLGQLKRSIAENGLVTEFEYDAAGRLVRTTATSDYGVRESNVIYNAFGEVVAELGGVGSEELEYADDPQDVWDQYGIRYEYDALGRRIRATRPDGSATWYFYDASGNLTFTADGVSDAQGTRNALIEVTEYRYNAFEQASEQLAYAGRLVLSVADSRASVAGALTTLAYVGGVDSRTQWSYAADGQVARQIDALGVQTVTIYDAFGQVKRVEQAAGTGRATSTAYTYDHLGQVLSTVQDAGTGRLNLTRTAQYDAFGRIVTSLDARGGEVRYRYDRIGQVVALAQTVDGSEHVTHTTYDAFGRKLSVADARGNTITYAYDEQGLNVSVTSAQGVVTTNTYDGFGQLRNVSGSQWMSMSYDADGHMTSRSEYDKAYESYQYDDQGRLTYQQVSGVATTYEYDDAGRVRASIQYGNDQLVTRYTYDALGREISVVDAAGVETSFNYDAAGQLLESVLDPGGLAIRTTYSWDELGRQLSVTQAAGTTVARTTTYGYDAAGRRIRETAAASKLDLTTTYTYDANGNVASRTDAAGRITRYAYDSADRLRFEVDGAGDVTEHRYDANGLEVAVRRYAAPIELAGMGLQVTGVDIASRVVRNDLLDQQQYVVRDDDGRVHATIDGAGGTTLYKYDQYGRVSKTTQLANATVLDVPMRQALESGEADALLAPVTDDEYDISQWNVYSSYGQLRVTVDSGGRVTEFIYDSAYRLAGTRTYAESVKLDEYRYIGSAGLYETPRTVLEQGRQVNAQDLVYSSDNDRRSVQVRNSAGQVAYELSSSGTGSMLAVKEYRYSESGQIEQEILHGVSISYNGVSASEVRSALTQAYLWRQDSISYGQIDPNLPAERRTTYVYDAAGRPRYVVSAIGAVTESFYDAAGQVTEQRSYDTLVPIGSSDPVQIAQALATATYTKQTYRYDEAGRVSAKGDGLDHLEWFAYDGTGLMVKHQDRTGAVWNYEYDAAGRKSAQLSPVVIVTDTDQYGMTTEVERRVVTRYEYDAQGNLSRLVEDADGSRPRETAYTYDNRGHQVRITFPDAGVLVDGELVASGQQPSVEVTYNVLGQAVMQKDVRGFYSYKAYDAGGHVLFDVDQSGGVTSYSYNGFGEQQRMTRYAAEFHPAAGQPLSDADVQALYVLDGADDRHLYTTYDAAGHKQDVFTMSYKTDQIYSYTPGYGSITRTNYLYDVFGNLIREAQLTDASGWNSESGLGYGAFAITYHYYDAAGQEIARMDPELYLTHYEYTARGELAKQTEYANPVYMYSYQRESHLPPQPPEGNAASGFDRVTTYAYDAAGRKISEASTHHITDVNGVVSSETLEDTFVYDAEGRVTNSKVKQQSLTMAYDSLGRLVNTVEAARMALNDAAEGAIASGAVTNISDAALYRSVTPTTTYRYDAFGNIVTQTSGVQGDADMAVQSFRYDWQGRNIQQVDALGNLVTRWFDEGDHVLQESRTVAYTPISETTSPRFNFSWQPVESLGDTAYFSTYYTYDAAGRQLTRISTREPYSNGETLGAVIEAGERVGYNSFGEVMGKDPDFDGEAAEGYAIQYQYDRSGNVSWTNEGGVQHWYTYDAASRVLTESHYPAMTTTPGAEPIETHYYRDNLGRVIETVRQGNYSLGVPSGVYTYYTYDRWGNRLSVRDANNSLTEFEYNENNQLVRQISPEVKVVSASGTISQQRPETRWVYDALGQLVATRDANGNGRRYEYDPRGRLVREFDATGGITRYQYDLMGNRALTQDAGGDFTLRKFDQAGRVVSVWGVNSENSYAGSATANYSWQEIERYVLDQDGNRLVSLDAQGHLLKAWYDGQGRMLRSETREGVVTEYEYDLLGNKIRERNALVGSASGGSGEGWDWYIDRDGQQAWFNERTWEYDAFGRVTDHNDLSGLDYDYLYDPMSGQLMEVSVSRSAGASSLRSDVTAQVAIDPEPGDPPEPAPPTLEYANGTRTYYYDIDGRIARIEEQGQDASGNDRTVWSRYEYDSLGNRTLEETYTYDANGQALQVRTTTSYDALNRIERVYQDDLIQQRRLLDVHYSYDAVGNRRLVEMGSQFNPAGNQPANASFESGNRDWSLGEGWSILQEEDGGDANTGTWTAQFDGSTAGPQLIINGKRVSVTPGQTITASAMVQQGASAIGYASAKVVVIWYDAYGNMLPGGEGSSWTSGNVVDDGAGGAWHQSSVSTTVPPGAAYMAIGASATNESGEHPLWVDDFQWSYSPGNVAADPPPNAGLESGDTGWTKGDGWVINQESTGGDAFTGGWSAQFNGSTGGPQSIVSDLRATVIPGQTVTASVMVQQGASSAGNASARVLIMWYDANGNLLPGGEGHSWSGGNVVSSGSGGAWSKSSVTATVPPGAAYMSIAANANKNPGAPLWVDDFQWNYVNPGVSDDELPVDTSYWFEYDAENRVVVSNGAMSNGHIVIGDDGVSSLQTYDTAGNAVYRKFYENGVLKEQQLTYDAQGRVIRILQALDNSNVWHVLETSRYDASGQLAERRQYADDGSAKHIDISRYDDDGRLVSQAAYGIPQGGVHQSGDYEGLDLLSIVTYQDPANAQIGYDDAGRLRGYTYHVFKNEEGSGATGPVGYTHTYRYTYQGAESYLTTQVSGISDNSNFKTSNSSSRYDDWGRLVAVRERTPGSSIDDRVRYFAMDAEGNILRRTEGTIENGLFTQDAAALLRTEQYVYSNGQYVASGRYDGKTDVLGKMAAYDDSGVGSYQVTIQAGDTLRSIAQRVYGNASLWYILADANALDSDAGLVAGAQLRVPDVKVNINDANTFKPFDPNEAIGPTTPSLPYIPKPSDSGCGTLGMIIMVVVAIVVTIYTAGAAAAAMGSLATATTATATATVAAGTTAGMTAAAATGGVMAAGAGALAGTYGAAAMVVGATAGAFAGSVASQAVGSAMGQTSFSWRNVAASTVAGAVTAGFGAYANISSPVLNAMATAAVGNVSAYAAGKMVGNDTSFSWRSVAASAVSAGVTAKLAPAIADELEVTDTSYGQGIVSGITGGVVSAHVRRGMLGEGIDDQSVFVDAFGNALNGALMQSSERPAVGNGGSGNLAYSDEPTYWLADLDGGMAGSGLPEELWPLASGKQGVSEVNKTSGAGGVADIPTMNTVYAVPDAGSRDGWYFYRWNEASRHWTDLQKPVPAGQVASAGAAPNWTNGYGTSAELGWRVPGVQNADSPLLAGYRNSAGQLAFKSDPVTDTMATAFTVGAGAVTAVYDGVAEPIKMLVDFGNVMEAASNAYWTDKPEDVQLYSAMGRAVQTDGAGTGQLLLGIPVGIATTPWRLGAAIYEGNAFNVGYESVALAAIFEGANAFGAGRVRVGEWSVASTSELTLAQRNAVLENVPSQAVSAVAGEGSSGVDLRLKYKEGWTEAQRAEADAKVKALNDSTTVVTTVNRSGTSASSRYRRSGGWVPEGYDVDHVVDLQLGGRDTVSNMLPLNSSVNRSLGAQIWWQIKDLPEGTVVNKVTIGD